MQEIYENIAENIKTNPQMLGFLEYCRKVEKITIAGFGSGLSTLVAISAKPKSITIYDHIEHDISDYISLALEMGVDLIFKNIQVVNNEELPETDMLLVDGFAEGNFVFSVCQKFSTKVNRYIAITNTFTNAHNPDPDVKVSEGGKPIGVIFGVNHFIQTNDPWHIADSLYWEPGMTILYRRKDLLDNGTSN